MAVARVLIAAGAVLLVLGVVLGGYQVYLRYQQAVEKQQVDRYTAGIQGPAQLAGQLVAQTIVPELDAYANGKLPAGKVAVDAALWRAFFVRTRAEFARVAHPGPVAAIAAQFDTALAEYIQAVTEVEKLASPSQAAEALLAGKAVAKKADCDYGRAAVALTGLRSSLDLPDVATFASANTNACR